MTGSWNSCGPDTIHATFKQGRDRSAQELACLLQDFQNERDLPTAAVIRDQGLSGFENAAIDKAAGLRLDWTDIKSEGTNAGYFCLQVKGHWFDSVDPEVAADFIQLLDAYGIYRITRIDFQQTTETKRRLTPWWIRGFESGNLRVVGKRFFEPRGKKDGRDSYPQGATLYHGSRTSERFARQYDKHLQDVQGPPRRRDEIEIKGDTSRTLWKELTDELLSAEQLGEQRGARLHSFSKRAIRAYLPIRDTSRWAGKDLPKDWAQFAKEPMNWAELFDEDAMAVAPTRRTASSLLKSYRYCQDNFGSSVSVMAALRYVEGLHQGLPANEASERAYALLLDDFVLNANEARAMEFIDELPASQREKVREHWFGMLRNAASNAERERD